MVSLRMSEVFLNGTHVHFSWISNALHKIYRLDMTIVGNPRVILIDSLFLANSNPWFAINPRTIKTIKMIWSCSNQFLNVQKRSIMIQVRRQEFPEGGRICRLAWLQGVWGPLKVPRALGYMYLEQNPAIWQFLGTSFNFSESPVFQNWFLKIFIKFYINWDFDSYSLNTISTLIVLISFQGGGGHSNRSTHPPTPLPATGM